MIERNGPGGMRTDSRSPMITSGVATRSTASNNIAVVITIAPANPANNPANTAFLLLTIVGDLTCAARQWNQIARRSLGRCSVRGSSADLFAAQGHCAED